MPHSERCRAVRAWPACAACAVIIAAGCSLFEAGTREFLQVPPGFEASEGVPGTDGWILAATSAESGDRVTRVYVKRGETLAKSKHWISCVSHPRPLLGSPEASLQSLMASFAGQCPRETLLSRSDDSELVFELTYGCASTPKEDLLGKIIYGKQNAYEIAYHERGPLQAGDLSEARAIVSGFALGSVPASP